MPAHGILIVETADGFRWRSVAGNASGHASGSVPETIAREIADFANQNRLNKRDCVLAVHSLSTLFARFPYDPATTSRDRDAMRYRLESDLPVDAENAIADYAFDKNQISAITILRDRWHSFMDAVESEGIRIQQIVPQIVCQLQSAVDRQTLRPDSVSLWLQDDGIDLVQLIDGTVTHWRHLPQDQHRPKDQQRLAAELKFIGTDSVDVRDLRRERNDEATTAWLANVPLAVEFYDEVGNTDADEVLLRQAGRYLSRKSEPWFQLRRDELASHDPWRTHRRELRRAVFACTAGLACVLGACWWQAHQYNSIAQQEDDRVREVFRQTLPGKRVPTALLTGLRTTKRSLVGVGAASKGIEPPRPAMGVLRRLMSALPEDTAIEVNQIRIENARFVIDLDTATIEDAGTVASSLQDAGMLVSPPSTTASNAGRVNARIEGVDIQDDPTREGRS